MQLVVLALMACSRDQSKQPITRLQSFKFQKNNAEAGASTTAQATTAAQETTSDTTRNANNLAREPLQKSKNAKMSF